MQRGAGPLVAILPGSRTQEVEANTQIVPASGRADRRPRAGRAVRRGGVQGVAGRDWFAGWPRERDVPIEVHVGRTPELIHAADCCLACSGSVSLELLYHAKPRVILYQVVAVRVLRPELFRKVRYITLVNLLTADDIVDRPAGADLRSGRSRDAHVLMPEYLTCEDRVGAARRPLRSSGSPSRRVRAERVAALGELRDRFAQGGASERAAEYIAADASQRRRRAAARSACLQRIARVDSRLPEARSESTRSAACVGL